MQLEPVHAASIVLEKRIRLLMHLYSISAWICSPVDQVRGTWYKMDEGDKQVLNKLLCKLYITPGLTKAETDKASAELINLFWDEWEQFSTKTGVFEAKYKWASADIDENRSHIWHKKHSLHCTNILGKFASVVTSKLTGIGTNERCWGDAKHLKDGKHSHLSSDALRKQSTLYGAHIRKEAAFRHARIIEANGRNAKGMCIWEDADFDACGLDKYGIDLKKEIEAAKPSGRRQFFAWLEDWELENIKTKDPVMLQKFVQKYRDINWVDLDFGTILTHHPEEMAWSSERRNVGISAFGLTEDYKMEIRLEEQDGKYQVWSLNEDFYDCVIAYYQRHPDPLLDVITKEDYYREPVDNVARANNSGSDEDSESSADQPAIVKVIPHGNLKRDDSEDDVSNDGSETVGVEPSPSPKRKRCSANEESDEEDTGELVQGTPEVAATCDSQHCHRCNRLFSGPPPCVFNGEGFHSAQCAEKFRNELSWPTPEDADLTGIADHAATPTRGPTSLVFESPTRKAKANWAAAAVKKPKATAKEKLGKMLKTAATAQCRASSSRGNQNIDDVLAGKTKSKAVTRKRTSKRKR